MNRPPLGDQQLEVLRYVTEHAPASVHDVVVGYGEPRGLSRTTILTVMEKLREKGYLTRRKNGGAYRYSPAIAGSELNFQIIHRFIQRSLGGAIAPFIAYLTRAHDLTPEEIAELERAVQELKNQEAGGRKQEAGEEEEGGGGGG